MELLKARLEQGVSILEKLDRKRQEANLPEYDYDLECLIIAQEMLDLEEDIQLDPGPLEPHLIHARGRSRMRVKR